jgi:hypothetical protein
MKSLKNNPNFIYKLCLKCDKHYERCNCEEPKWGTSHDGVSIEEAMGTPTLADDLPPRIQAVSSKEEFAQVDQKMKESCAVVEDLRYAPAEVREKVERLRALGIEVKVYKGTDAQLAPLLSEIKSTEEFRVDADEVDKLHYEAYTKSGGKLN